MYPAAWNMRATTYDSFNSTYSVFFDGKTIETKVTDKAADVDSWIEEAITLHGGKPTVVGLDNEWRPNRICYLSNKTAALQLCIDDKCLIVQLM
ncbi:hypothetical protein MLD38_006520 [Melastoma candidum]|uniref:Uncharacterized protein n=1 Tax=Melastoma candidum TaxID=119954 RepID=A0ACB9RNP9_9MYRT|nr:hypothetical protein MLD38_006520 [Melastoma candidum]